MSTPVTNNQSSFVANTNPDYTVAAEVIAAQQYQYVKLIDSTAASTTPIGTSSNPIFTSSVPSTSGSLTGSAPATGTVGTSSATLVAANVNRRGCVITVIGSGSVFLAFGANAAVINSGIALPGARSVFIMDAFTYSREAINAIASAAGVTVSIQEFV